MFLPQLHLGPWFQGQLGVPGSAVPRGIRTAPSGIVLYVAKDHPNATTTADGLNPEYPLSTITAAMARLVAFHAESSISAANSVIVVAPGIYTDNIVIANATYPEDCTIVGASSNKFGVIWRPAAGDALAIDQGGWVVDNIHFQPSGTGAGVKLTWTAGSGGEDAVIQNCFFDGRWGTGLYGIEFEGAPANVSILNNRFAEFDAASPAITVTSTATACPYQTHILGNTFQECAEYIASDAGGWNASIIAYNHFVAATGDLAATTTFIDMGTAALGCNQIVGNFLDGDYSNAGGYTAGSAGTDNWVGNIVFDVAEAEVGDNGFSITQPAA